MCVCMRVCVCVCVCVCVSVLTCPSVSGVGNSPLSLVGMLMKAGAPVFSL